jgi:membrane protein
MASASKGGVWMGVKETVNGFVSDDAMSLAGALAFYTALSLAPMLVILLRIASLLGEGTQQKLAGQIEGVVGQQAGQAIKMIMDSADKQPGWGSFAGIVSLVVLILSASGVFAQLQMSLNRIWNVKAKPSEGIWGWVRKRLLSIGMILALAFILLVSLAISAVIGVMMSQQGVIWQAVNFIVSLGVFTVLFAAIFKYLPDVKMAWRDVWTGAITTAVLFAIGKWLIGLYLGHSSVASSYGAAGSLLVLLLWVYYSSLLVFLGAELTQVQARMRGSPIRPDAHAEWDKIALEAKGQRPATA